MNQCFHCELSVPANTQYQLNLLGNLQQFCCPGCLAVAKMIRDNGLEQFYQYRTKKNNQAIELLPQELLEIEAIDQPEILANISQEAENDRTIQLGIEGITCAACGWLLKTELSQSQGVINVEVNTTTHRMMIQFNKQAQLSNLIKQIAKLGYRAYPFTVDQQEKSVQIEDKRFIRRLLIAGLGMMQVMMFSTGLYIGDYQDISDTHATFLHWVSGLVATPVVFYSALPFFKSAWGGLKSAHFGMNLPVSLAILTGYFASVYSLLKDGNVFYFDSVVMFTFFLVLGRFLEHRARLKALIKQQNFKQLLPLSVQRKDADGQYEVIPTTSIQIGDKILVSAGGIVPVDGLLQEAIAEVNEAVITGEFLPVVKTAKQMIYSGSTNTAGNFLIEATSNAQNCRLQKLIQLQESTEHLISDRVSLADKFAHYYVMIILVLSAAVGYFWWTVDPSKVFPVILSMLIVTCPCALSLATPAAVTAAVAKLTDLGLMIKERGVLNKLAKVTHVFLDKTGTVTFGEVQIESVETFNHFKQEQVLSLACSLESRSSHPIARPFKQCDFEPVELDDYQEIIASGLSANWNNQIVKLGKLDFVFSDLNANEKALLCEKTEKTLSSAQMNIFLTINHQLAAIFVLDDTINETIYPTLASFNDLTTHTCLLSGDSQRAVSNMAQKLNLNHYMSNASPEKKLATIKDSKSKHTTVLMVGDGVNDVGAIGAADVGITVGKTSYLSRSNANAVLISQNLTAIPQAIVLARKLNRVIQQNLSWAVAYNLIAVPFAIAGVVPAWLAAIGMTSSSLIVVLNALRLRK